MTPAEEYNFWNTLTCSTPRWGYGYKAAILSVIEESEDGRIPLWQRTCVRRGVCGYFPLLDVVKYFDFEDITLRQLWWLKGSSIKSLRKEDNLARDFDRSYDMHVKDRIVSSLCKSFEYVCDTRAQCLTG